MLRRLVRIFSRRNSAGSRGVIVDSDGSRRTVAIPDHESAVRRLMADAEGAEFVAYETATAARSDPDAALVMQGDYGGQIYLACPLRVVAADEATLTRLLRDLDAIAWESNDGDGADVTYERLPVGAGVAGGMGGGIVAEEIWVHDEFVNLGLAEQVRQVIRGELDRLGRTSRAPTEIDRASPPSAL